ncbi:MAG: dUTP diphosphatase [Planctomycetota bacterium]|jgi:dUTP pyrophosphatase
MLKVKKLNRNAILPVKKTGDAAYDLYSCETRQIPPRDQLTIRTGISCEFPSNYVARICDRSGMVTNEGLHIMAGVIDPSYRGEWKIVLYNTTDSWKVIQAQTRIAQVLFYEVADFPIQEVTELSETERGTGGFGSTGSK